MKNKLINLILMVMTMLAIGWNPAPAMAQSPTPIPFTTLTNAITTIGNGTNQQTVTFGSTTNMLAGYVLVIDHEGLLVNSVTNSTQAVVTRGWNGTFATTHNAGSITFTQPATNYSQRDKYGSCSAANLSYLPVVSFNTTQHDIKMYDCPNGNWVQVTLPGDSPMQTYTRYCVVPTATFPMFTTAGTTYIYGNNTTPVSGTQYFGNIEIPRTIPLVTGLSLENGTVASTDKYIFTIYRADGTVLYNTPVAGTTATGTASYQDIALAAPIMLPGPERYWLGVQTNGNTTRFSTVPVLTAQGSSNFTGLLGSSFTGTFATVANLPSIPTSLWPTAAPNMCVY